MFVYIAEVAYYLFTRADRQHLQRQVIDLAQVLRPRTRVEYCLLFGLVNRLPKGIVLWF